MENKICSVCKTEKCISEFPFKNTIKNIKHSACLECWKEIRKRSYEKNKQAALDRNKKNNKKTIDWFKEYKSTLKCSQCGENHISCLDFHHTRPTEKEYSVSNMLNSTYSINRIKKELDKCIVLCSNCHRKHHYNEKKGPIA